MGIRVAARTFNGRLRAEVSGYGRDVDVGSEPSSGVGRGIATRTTRERARLIGAAEGGRRDVGHAAAGEDHAKARIALASTLKVTGQGGRRRGARYLRRLAPDAVEDLAMRDVRDSELREANLRA